MQLGRLILAVGVFFGAAVAAVEPAWAWGAHGHRMITYVALDGLPPEAPAWLREDRYRHWVAEQSNEPDRWRGNRSLVLGHENKPDHYIDIELLGQFGLTFESLPQLRSEYLRALVISKHLHPEQVDPYDPASDPDRSKEWPGMLPYAIAEHYFKLQQSWNQFRVVEQLNDPKRAHQLEMARANVLYHMGMLSHFVGDAAQPLHTTRHFNGWTGENPNGYTTDKGFHAAIDDGKIQLHQITYADLKATARYDAKVKAADPWEDVGAYIQRSFAQVEPLYQLQKSGALDGDEGKRFLIERLTDAGATLSALYWAAYVSGTPSDKDLADFQKYNDFNADRLPSAPAPTPPSAGAAPH